jgi:uncharacterized protein
MRQYIRKLYTLPIRFYKLIISPALPGACRYHPSCSTYAIQALERHGLLKGLALAFARIFRCSPAFSGGYDPVPRFKDWKHILAWIARDYRRFRFKP